MRWPVRSAGPCCGWRLLYDPADVWVVGGYLLAQIGLFAALRRGIPGVPFLEGVIDEPAVRAVVRTAFWAISVAVLVLVQVDSDGTAALGCAFLTVLSLLAFAYCDSRLDDVVAAAGTLAAALLALWSLPLPVDQRIGLLHNLPPEAGRPFPHGRDRLWPAAGSRWFRGPGASAAAEPVGRPVGGGAADPSRRLVLANCRLRSRSRLDGRRAGSGGVRNWPQPAGRRSAATGRPRTSWCWPPMPWASSAARFSPQCSSSKMPG